MPTVTRAPFHLLGLALALATFAGCDTAEGPSLYDPIQKGTYQPPRPDPVLTGIEPAVGLSLAGVTTLTLTGQNFAPSPDSTFVYFNGTRYPVLAVTPTTITMKAPNLPSRDVTVRDLMVRVAVVRAEHFSQQVGYALLPAVERLGELAVSDQPFGLASDADGNVYFSVTVEGKGGGIRKSTPQGAFTQYASATAATYPDLAYAPATGLLGVRNVRAVFKINEGGTADGTPPYVVLPPAQLVLRAIDTDDAGVVWTGGSGTGFLYRVGLDKAVSPFPAPGSVLALEVRDDFLYASVVSDGVNKIVRYPLSGQGLGAAEDVVNVTATFPEQQVTALAFTAGGDLIMGTTLVPTAPATQVNEAPLLERLADGTFGELYDGLLVGNVAGLTWGTGNMLYASGPRIVASKESSATKGDLVVINTLRQGER